MILKKMTLIFCILILATNLQANTQESSKTYEKCEFDYSLCIEFCDSQEDSTEKCYEKCDIQQVRCEEKENSK